MEVWQNLQETGMYPFCTALKPLVERTASMSLKLHSTEGELVMSHLIQQAAPPSGGVSLA